MAEALLFRKCLGLNDARAFGTQTLITDYRAEGVGSAEFTDCMDLTVTDDGAVEKISAFTSVIAHSAPVTNIAAGYDRFIYQDSVDTKEWDGTNIATIGAVLNGPVAFTPIDVRLSTSTKVYKSVAAGAALSEAALGNLSNLPDRDKKPYYKQPPFAHSLMHHGHLYGVSADDSRFLQWSMWTQFDAFRLGDDFMQAGIDPIMQFGSIPGVLLTTHESGVTVYMGEDAGNVTKRFYPCAPYDKTLYSGLVSKNVGQMHIFMAADGIYGVGGDGVFKRLTESLDTPGAVNSSYTCATVTDRKYLAFGNVAAFEYDFKNSAVMKRSPLGVVGACVFRDVTYYATGSSVVKSSGVIDTGSAIQCSFTLPFSNLGTPGKKSIDALYFTGTMTGVMTITATDQDGGGWDLTVDTELASVSNYRIKTPRCWLGNHISFKFECTSGAFRMEGLRAVFNTSKRSY